MNERTIPAPVGEARAETPAEPLLQVRGLRLDVKVGSAVRPLVQDVSFEVAAGRSVGVVGESGSGKSLTARAVMRLLPPRTTVTGDVLFEGRSVFAMSGSELRRFRNREVAMIHQDPRAAINPVRTVGDFLSEGVRHLPRAQRLELAAAALRDVGIDDGERRFRQYPHQLSGGLLQRVVIAAALMQKPRLVLADEPTTALDVTTQSEVMAVLSELQSERRLGMVFITHDLDLAAAVTDSIAVMYAGVIVESGPTRRLHDEPLHPYTAALIAARPSTTEVARLRTVPGRPVAAFETGPGCVFATRCPFAQDVCHEVRPESRRIGEQTVSCHRAEELRGRMGELSEVPTP